MAHPTTPGGSGCALCGLQGNPAASPPKRTTRSGLQEGDEGTPSWGRNLLPLPGARAPKGQGSSHYGPGWEPPPPGGHPSCGWPHHPPEGGSSWQEAFGWSGIPIAGGWRVNNHSPNRRDRNGRDNQMTQPITVQRVPSKPCVTPGSTGRQGVPAPSSATAWQDEVYPTGGKCVADSPARNGTGCPWHPASRLVHPHRVSGRPEKWAHCTRSVNVAQLPMSWSASHSHTLNRMDVASSPKGTDLRNTGWRWQSVTMSLSLCVLSAQLGKGQGEGGDRLLL